MFPVRYFCDAYYAPRYWPGGTPKAAALPQKIGATAAAGDTDVPALAIDWRRWTTPVAASRRR